MLKTYNYLALITLCLSFILIIILNKPQIFPDSYYYYEEGKKLFETNYTTNSFKLLYSAWIFLNFLSYKLLENNWYYLIILLNLFSSLLIIYYSIKLINLSNLYNFFLFILIQLFCLDLWIYNSYVLSDLIFTLIAFTIFISIFKFVKFKNNKYIFLSIALSIILCLLRPTAFPVIGFIIIALISKNKYLNLLNNFFYVFIFFVIILSVSIAQNFFINFRAESEIEIIKSYFYWLDLQFKNGIVVYDRPEYNLESVNNIFSIIRYNTYKIFMYFNFIPNGYSNLHKLINFIYLSLIIITILKFRVLDRKKFDKEAAFLIFLFIFTFGFFHMITIIDYDWRYRLPILPVLSLFPFLIFESKNLNAR